MILLEELTELDCVEPLLEGTLVVANLLSGLSSHVWTVLRLRELKCLVVVRTDRILVRPKHSDERSIASLFSLGFPAVIVDLDHNFVFHSSAHVRLRSFTEFFNKVLLALLLVIYCCLLEMVYNPLVIRWCHLDIERY